MQPELSVIILNYNAAPFLRLCLKSVERALTSINAEIIVGDNASTDGSVEMILQEFPYIKLLDFKVNHGFSRGNNLMVQQAMGKHICILNPDTVVGEKVFEECLAFAKAEHKETSKPVGFIGVQLIDGSGTFLPESKRRIPTPEVVRQKFKGDSSSYYDSRLKKDGNGTTEVLAGAFMFCRKDVYSQCGGFDERYFMYGEDIDLSYTALQNGYENYYLGTSCAIHFKGESTQKDRQTLKRFYNAMQLFYSKYYRKNMIDGTIIKLVAKVIPYVKATGNKVALPSTSPDNAVVVSSKIVADSNLEYLTLADLQASDVPYTTLIWDIDRLKITEVIAFMSLHAGRYKYRFLDHASKSVLGSDSSNLNGFSKAL